MSFSLCAAELVAIQKLCRQDIHACPVARLQEHFSDYPVVERLYPILNGFYHMFRTFHSDVTSKIWMQVCGHDLAGLQDLAERVWPNFLGKLKEMLVSMSQLKVPCGEAQFLMPTGTAPQQLRNAVKGLKACGMPVSNDINFDEISSKVRLYDGLRAVSKEAEQLLTVTKKFDLQGDFTIVVNIANVSCSTTIQYRLHISSIYGTRHKFRTEIRGIPLRIAVNGCTAIHILPAPCPQNVHALSTERLCCIRKTLVYCMQPT